MAPPKSSSASGRTAVVSRTYTLVVFIFSWNTSHRCGSDRSANTTELCTIRPHNRAATACAHSHRPPLSSAQLSSARAGVAQIYLNRFADRTGCRATSASRVRSRQAAARSAKPSAVVLEGHDSMCATGRSQPIPRDNARHRRCGRAGARSRRKCEACRGHVRRVLKQAGRRGACVGVERGADDRADQLQIPVVRIRRRLRRLRRLRRPPCVAAAAAGPELTTQARGMRRGDKADIGQKLGELDAHLVHRLERLPASVWPRPAAAAAWRTAAERACGDRKCFAQYARSSPAWHALRHPLNALSTARWSEALPAAIASRACSTGLAESTAAHHAPQGLPQGHRQRGRRRLRPGGRAGATLSACSRLSIGVMKGERDESEAAIVRTSPTQRKTAASTCAPPRGRTRRNGTGRAVAGRLAAVQSKGGRRMCAWLRVRVRAVRWCACGRYDHLADSHIDGQCGQMEPEGRQLLIDRHRLRTSTRFSAPAPVGLAGCAEGAWDGAIRVCLPRACAIGACARSGLLLRTQRSAARGQSRRRTGTACSSCKTSTASAMASAGGGSSACPVHHGSPQYGN